MDSETKRRIEETISEILKKVDMDSITEFNVRAMAAELLSMDLSHLPYKKFIRHLIESFLLSIHDDDHDDGGIITSTNDKEIDGALQTNSDADTVAVGEELDDTKPGAAPIAKDVGGDWSRLICKLSNKRHVTVTGSEGKTVVSIKEFYGKDGKHSSLPRFDGKRVEEKSNNHSTPNGLVPIEVIRFNGKNYHQWERRMELLLNQLKVAYVLVDPCPSAAGASTEAIAQVVAAAQKWMDDDYICHLRLEEQSRGKGSTGGAPLIRHYVPEPRQMRNLGPNRIFMKKPSGSGYHEMERDKKFFKFCNVCRKKGHLAEQCWFRKPGNRDDDNNVSAHAVTDAKMDEVMP